MTDDDVWGGLTIDLDGADDVDLTADDDDFEPESSCPDCGATFAGNQVGHCRGGRYSGCCQNFASLHAFDKHRTGPFNPDGLRRCLTTDELTEKDWVKTGPYDSWRTPPPANNPWKKDNP